MADDTTALGERRFRDQVHGGTFFRRDGPATDAKNTANADHADKTVVLIHGVGLDNTLWDAQVAQLKDHFHIVRYDMLGHGQSAHPPGQRQLGDFVRQLHQLLMNLQIPRAAIIGFSMGSLVARAFAIKHPQMANKLVLMNSVFRRNTQQQDAVNARLALAEAGGLQEGIEAAVGRWFSPEFITVNPALIQTIETRLRGNDADGFLNAYRVFASTEDPPQNPLPITCPTLVLTGELDSGSTPAMTQNLAAAIPGAKAHVLPGLRHMAALEDPIQVNELLFRFLSRNAGLCRKV